MNLNIVKNDPPESKEILAEAILRLGDASAKLKSNGLNRKAIVLLLHDMTKVGKREIETILDALPILHRHYCR